MLTLLLLSSHLIVHTSEISMAQQEQEFIVANYTDYELVFEYIDRSDFPEKVAKQVSISKNETKKWKEAGLFVFRYIRTRIKKEPKKIVFEMIRTIPEIMSGGGNGFFFKDSSEKFRIISNRIWSGALDNKREYNGFVYMINEIELKKVNIVASPSKENVIELKINFGNEKDWSHKQQFESSEQEKEKLQKADTTKIKLQQKKEHPQAKHKRRKLRRKQKALKKKKGQTRFEKMAQERIFEEIRQEHEQEIEQRKKREQWELEEVLAEQREIERRELAELKRKQEQKELKRQQEKEQRELEKLFFAEELDPEPTEAPEPKKEDKRWFFQRWFDASVYSDD